MSTPKLTYKRPENGEQVSATAAVSRWKSGMTGHQGVRGAMKPADEMTNLLDAKLMAALNDQYVNCADR